jgi:DNA helicase-2/ATP-dependent DNA helicase PcrA
VAITRAKTRLHLLAPLRYYVTPQPHRGDAHVFGARSRFMSRAVLAQLEEATWPTQETGSVAPGNDAPRVDVAGKLRGMWG